MSDALGTPGGVVSDEDHRLAMAGVIAAQSTSIAARTGVMWGPGSTAIITGTAATGTMTVNVGVHHWVTSRSAADGVYLGAKEASTPVNIAAAPGANSRIDVVYSKQNDTASTISADTGTTQELYGVLTGTAAASPTKPSLSTIVGAVEIGTVTVAAGATATNGAGVTIANTAALTVARGADIPVRNQAERDALTTFPFLTVKRLDTGKVECRNVGNTAWVTLADPALASPTAPSWNPLTMATGWTAYTASGVYDPPAYRIEGFRVFLRGWAQTTATTGAGGAVASALPVAARPPKARPVWPHFDTTGGQSATVRLEMTPAGVLSTYWGVAGALYFSLDGCSYDL